MRRSMLARTALLLFAIAQPRSVAGQPPRASRDTTIDDATRAQIIDTMIARLDAGHVFPEKAADSCLARLVLSR